MKKKLALLLCGVMCFANVLSVSAAEYNAPTDDAEVPLAFVKDSYFTVTLPEAISGSNGVTSVDFEYSVEGDIAANEKVTVKPVDVNPSVDGAQLELSDVTGETMDANVSIPKTDFNYDEIWEKNVQHGTVSVDELPAGTWNGVAEFLINLDNIDSGVTESGLTLSEDDVVMGTSNSTQVNAYIDGELANDSVSWVSDNENITVTNGLVETKASAQVGDTATVTVSAEGLEEQSSVYGLRRMATVDSSSDLSVVSSVRGAGGASTASFTVTVIDMAYTATGEDTTITSLSIAPGESKDVEVSIIPTSATGTVSWSTTAPAGLNLAINGNTVTLRAASDMTEGNTYDLVASYGTFSKLLRVTIGSSSSGGGSSSGGSGSSTTTETPGLYDADGNMTYSWQELLNKGTVRVSDGVLFSQYKVADKSNASASVLKGKLVLPSTVKTIGNNALYNCTNLTEVVIPSGVTSIGKNGFYNCSGLTEVIVPNSVTTIGDYAFMNCSNLSVYIPTDVTLGTNALYGVSHVYHFTTK